MWRFTISPPKINRLRDYWIFFLQLQMASINTHDGMQVCIIQFSNLQLVGYVYINTYIMHVQALPTLIAQQLA